MASGTNSPAQSIARRRGLALGATVLATSLSITLLMGPSHAGEIPASGTFTWTTAPGILPAWDAAGISLVGVSPGTVFTSSTGVSARVVLPVVAKAGTANATAGGFRFVNSRTGESVRCSVPTVDTRARVVDCVLPSGYNAALFEITDIESWRRWESTAGTSTVFQGIELRLINREMANRLNDELETSVFSASVVVGNGSLLVSRDVPED